MINNVYTSEITIRSESSFVPTYKNRFSFIAGLNPSYAKAGDMNNLTLSYGRAMDDYWIDTNLAMNNGLFYKFSANNKDATGASDDQINVFKKFSDFFSAGAHLNYNLAVVKRAQANNTLSNSKRSLTLGFLTIGFDLSVYL